MGMPLGRFLAYGYAIEMLEAEEGLRWLALMHPGKDPDKLVRRLRKRAGLGTMPQEAQTEMLAFLTNPFLAQKTKVVDKIEP